MRVLGIETATSVCGAAVVRDGVVGAEETIESKNVHAERLMGLIDTILVRSGCTAESLDAVAVSIGPGSFTGLRIGLSVAKGLCFALEKPLVAVSTLHALAQRAVDAGIVKTPFLLPAFDARRDEVYCTLFHVREKSMKQEWEIRDMTLQSLFMEIANLPTTITGDAKPKLQAHGSDSVHFVPDEYSTCRASTVALMGEQKALQGEFADTRTLEPMYVKEFHTTSKY